MPAWDPTLQQSSEADTLLFPDLTDLASLNASQGRIEAPSRAAQSANVAGYTFAAGKFTPSIKPLGTVTSSRFFYWNADGLLSGDQFTIEFWAMHDTLDWPSVVAKTLFAINTPTLFVPLTFGALSSGISTNWTIYPHLAGTSPKKINRSITIPDASLNFAAGEWVSVALVKKTDHTMRLYLNGVDVGGVTGFNIPQAITDHSENIGLRFGGTDAGASGFAISDIRVSRTARTPGVTPTLKSLDGTLTVNTASIAGVVPPNFLGCLHGFPPSTPVDDVSAVMKVMRTNKLLSATPIKAGATDGTHPTLGQSGLYSYDWQVCDRSLKTIADHGSKAWISLDIGHNLLGGSVAPFSGTSLTDVNHLAFSGNDNKQAPNDMTAWVHLVKDFVYHVLNEITGFTADDVQCWSLYNEPDGGFWLGTVAEYMDHYARTMSAVRLMDPDSKPIIGPEIVGIYGNPTWVNAMVAKRAALGNVACPLEGFSYHDYRGDIRGPNDARAVLDEAETANGFTAGTFPLWIGEFNWNLHKVAFGLTQSSDPQENYTTLRAHHAAYTTAYVCNGLTTTDMRGIAHSHITTIDQYGPNGAFGYGQPGNPRNLGFAAMQLIGPNGEHWGPYNAMKGLQMVLGDERLTITPDLPPGVYAYAGRDSATSRIGVALAQYGWAALEDRDVTITFSGLSADNYTVSRYQVDATHSSRWDTFADASGGSVDQELELMSETEEALPGALTVTVPSSGSVFMTVEQGVAPTPDAGGIRRLVLIDGDAGWIT